MTATFQDSLEDLNNNCQLTAVLSVSNDSYSKFYLAYIGNILCSDVIYDLIKAEAHVQNCKTSDWSDYIYLVGHMIMFVLIDSHWSKVVIWPKQNAKMTVLKSAVFNWIVFIRWYFL